MRDLALLVSLLFYASGATFYIIQLAKEWFHRNP